MRARWIVSLFALGLAIWPASMIAQAPAAAPAPPERKLQLTFTAGNVTLVAQNVTLREILAEWSRQGGCVFDGADKLTGGTLPQLRFDNQPEAAVLQSLLRSAAGYMVAPRRIGSTGASAFETVYVLATSHPTSMPAYGVSTSPIAAPLVVGSTDEIPPVTPPLAPLEPRSAQPPAGPASNTMPGVYVPTPSTAPVPGAPTTGPGRGGTGRGGGGGSR